MQDVPVTRAAHVIGPCEILREIGTPVERELAKSNLPTLIEEIPDAWVNSVFGMAFASRCADIEGIEDFGWLAAKHFKSSQLNEQLVSALVCEATVKARLQKLFDLAAIEDSDYRPEFGRLNSSVEVFADGGEAASFVGYEISEWVQIAVVIEPIRSVLGADWCPDEIAFTSDFKVCDEARAAFPNTRFRMNAKRTAISFPVERLSASTAVVTSADCIPSHKPIPATFAELLQDLVRPYVREGRFPISNAAELMGLSTRSLQRKLSETGVRYSELIEATRFHMAADLLHDPDARLIDVAQAVGFEDQSNLGRCFRRIAGVSPGGYRRMIQNEQIAL